MIATYIGRIVWVALLLAGVTLGGMYAFAQNGGEQRFKLSGPEAQQPAPDMQTSDQPAAAQQAGEPLASDQAVSEPTARAQPTPSQQVPDQTISEPVLPMQPNPDQPVGSETSSAVQEQTQPKAPAAVSKPEDDLPPPMAADEAAEHPSKAALSSQARQLGGKPLEIVPIREGKLSNLSKQGQAAKPGTSKKSGQSGKAGQSEKTRTARPFWLDPKRHAADLSFKQGAVAFILGADIGRRGTYKTFLLDKPARRVVDIPGRWRYDGPTDHPVRFDGVGLVRVGEHPNYLRIVFDYVQGEARPPLVHTTPDGISVIYFWGE